MPPNPSKLLALGSLPEDLGDLLKREAALVIARQRLNEAVALADRIHRTLNAGRPWMSYFLPSQNRDYVTAKTAADDDLIVLRTGLAKFDKLEKQLRLCTERRLELYLRQNDPDYLIHLVDQRSALEWQRLLDQFDEITRAIDKRFGAFQTLLGDLLQTEPCGNDPHVRRVIAEIVAIAGAADAEVVFFNQLSELQRTRLGPKGNTLFKQQPTALADKVFGLLELLPAVAIKATNALADQAARSLQQIRTALSGACQLLGKPELDKVEGHHAAVRRALRDAAVAQAVAENLEAIVAETEARFDSGRLAEWGFLQSAFSRAIPAVIIPAVVEVPQVVVVAPVAPAPVIKAVAVTNPPLTVPLRVPVKEPEPAVQPAAAAAEEQKGPSLRLKGRAGSARAEAGAATSERATTAANGATAKQNDADPETVARLKAEQERLQRLIEEARASLNQREEFIMQSEARLLEKSQAQIEREVELEQREEELRDLERRVREKVSGSPVAELLPAQEGAGKQFDEFNE